MTTPVFLSKPTSAGLFWGTIGGLALILGMLVTNKGMLQIIPYPFVLVAALYMFKIGKETTYTFTSLFLTGVLTFVVMSYILYIYTLTVVNPGSQINLQGHLWRSGVILGIGVLASFLLTLLANMKLRSTTD